jgi:oxygen-independent coproporphyrinogen-3 oxidase
MHRAHNAIEANNCVKIAQDNGISNLTIDLIYGIPSLNHDHLQHDLNSAFALNTNHISAYCLTIEDKTAFGQQVKKGKMKPIDEEFAAQQYEIMVTAMETNGFEQYEISNFAKNQNYAVHNSNYWKQKHYLGVGPGAHSYNGYSRQYNISNNNKYIKLLKEAQKTATSENLSLNDQTNEYVLTTLRTKWGCNLKYLEELNPNFIKLHKYTIEKLISKNLVLLQNQILYLSKEGKMLADKVSEEFFIV